MYEFSQLSMSHGTIAITTGGEKLFQGQDALKALREQEEDRLDADLAGVVC